jgi:hypothetical protein
MEREEVIGVMKVREKTKRDMKERANRLVRRVKEMVEERVWVVGLSGKNIEEDGDIKRLGKRIVREEEGEVKVKKEEIEIKYASEDVILAA